MDRSQIPSILREIKLNDASVVNIYNYGSWVYGTNKPTSDRDIMVITRSNNSKPLKYDDDFEYFHDFELHKLWNQYDVCVHTIENFEELLKKNYLLAVECIFLPDEFKIKEEIDFRSIYLEKYYDQARLRTAALYENAYALKQFKSNGTSTCSKRSSQSGDAKQSKLDFLFKTLFHGVRYLDFAKQLIETRSIHDFKSMTHVFNEMKDLRGDSTDESTKSDVSTYIEMLSDCLKAEITALVPTNIIKGTFEAHVTFECSHNTNETIEKLQKACENSKYKLIFIELDGSQHNNNFTQLMSSSYYTGEYPSIVKTIEDEVRKKFSDFNILRIKIESLASNDGVPLSDAEKELFWNKETNYFEFHYKVLVKQTNVTQNVKQLRNVCESNRNFHLHVSRNAFKIVHENEAHYMVTMRLFNSGRKAAFKQNEEVIEYLTRKHFEPLKVVREYIVYDSHIELDSNWK